MPTIPEQRAEPGASAKTRQRRLRATFIDKRGLEPPVAEDKGRARFPIGNEAQARNALARLPQAKGLTKDEMRIVAQRAVNVLGKVTPSARKYGVDRVTRSRSQAIERKPVILRPKKQSVFGRQRRGFRKKRRAGFKRGR